MLMANEAFIHTFAMRRVVILLLIALQESNWGILRNTSSTSFMFHMGSYMLLQLMFNTLA